MAAIRERKDLMMQRYCDGCGSLIGHNQPFFVETLQACYVIVGAHEPSHMLVFQRDLCRSCVPSHARGALPPVAGETVNPRDTLNTYPKGF
jgi:hypothetical protein